MLPIKLYFLNIDSTYIGLLINGDQVFHSIFQCLRLDDQFRTVLALQFDLYPEWFLVVFACFTKVAYFCLFYEGFRSTLKTTQL